MNAKTILLLPAAAAACLLFSACDSAGTGSTTESGVVSGRLLAPGGAPLAGARVTLLPADHVPSPVLRKGAAAGEAVTDADGYYRIARVDSGLYDLSAGRDSLAYFRDSLGVPAAGLDAGSATASPAGSLSGRVRLLPGDEARTVLILVIGTNVLAVPGDTSGAFVLSGLAEGEYRVRFLSTLSTYAPLDTALTVRSGKADTLAAPVRLRFKGIPQVTGLTARWDADAQAVALAWDATDSSLAAGYNVYRAADGGLMGTVPINAAPLRTPAYRDTAVETGKTYAYAVKAVDKNGNAGTTLSAPASAATMAAYGEAAVFKPEGAYDWGSSPLAVAGGEIFWLRGDRVDVFDSAGTKSRTFGKGGTDSLVWGKAIRIAGDTVLIVDPESPPGAEPGKTWPPEIRIRMYTLAGTFLGKVDVAGIMSSTPDMAFDVQKGPDGRLYLSNGQRVYALGGDGKYDSTEAPLPAYSLRMEPVAGGWTMLGSYCQLGSGAGFCAAVSAKVGFDLKVGASDSIAAFINAYAADPAGKLWRVRDGEWVEARDAEGGLARRFGVPKRAYRHLQVGSGDAVYLYDTDTGAIRIWKRK